MKDPNERRTFNDQLLRDASVGRHHQESAADAVDRLIKASPSKTPNQKKIQPNQSPNEYKGG